MPHRRHSTAPKNLVSRLLQVTLLAVLLAMYALVWTSSEVTAQGNDVPAAAMPQYDDDGQLLLPEDYRQWIFVGSSLGLSYSEGGGGHEMFHHTLMEPSAYDHFRRTGDFRQGTMLALLLHNPGDNSLPQRQGRFAGAVQTVEMAVKDGSTNSADVNDWAYYGFGTARGLRDRATAFEADTCASCHAQHAAHDNVFMQFYPLLREEAPEGFALERNAGSASESTNAPEVTEAEEASSPLALEGLDPVLLTEGHEELGKPEIVVEHGDYRYQFVSEPTRARFEADPTRYGVQNSTCPVVPGAAVNPDLYAVHDGRIYLFASRPCIETFTADPQSFVSRDSDEPTEREESVSR